VLKTNKNKKNKQKINTTMISICQILDPYYGPGTILILGKQNRLWPLPLWIIRLMRKESCSINMGC
jgi:hypothetical protein